MSVHETGAKHKYSFGILFLVVVLVLLICSASFRHISILLLAAFTLLNIVHLSSMAVAGRLFGVRLKEFSLFYGPSLFQVKCWGTAYVMRMIPTGGFIKLYGMDENNPEETGFRELPAFKRAVIIASGPIATFLLASACIGLRPSFFQFIHGFKQVFLGAFTPTLHGRYYMERLAELSVWAKFPLLVGLLGTKLAAWDLFPIPGLPGGRIVVELIKSRKLLTDKQLVNMNVVGTLVIAVVMVGWIIALLSYIFAPRK